MDEKTISVTEKVIGDTLYIIESAVSSTAKETAYANPLRMLFCADCGNKLYQVRGRGWEHDKEHFVCATYRKIKGGCSSHQIRNVVVEELLLDGIHRVTALVS